MVERYVAAHRRRDTYKGLEIAVKGKQEFINEVLYRDADGYQEPIIGACLVGHQLLFDLTRFITDVMTPEGTLIWGVRRGAGWGLSAENRSSCAIAPSRTAVSIPACGSRSSAGSSTAMPSTRTSVPDKTDAQDGSKRRKRDYTGRFLDTIPFGLALRKCKSAKLEVMGEVFNARERKRPHPDFTGPLTVEFLDYLVGDVRATYWLSVAELEDYQRLGIARTPESIFSTASLAKGFQHAFGIPRAKQRSWHLGLPALGYSSDDVEGFAAVSYFGTSRGPLPRQAVRGHPSALQVAVRLCRRPDAPPRLLLGRKTSRSATARRRSTLGLPAAPQSSC